MPELPEVDHIVRYLGGLLPGRQGIASRRADPKARRPAGRGGPSLESLEGARLVSASRRAKLVLLTFRARGRTLPTLVFHLKLTGKLWVQPASMSASRWTR